MERLLSFVIFVSDDPEELFKALNDVCGVLCEESIARWRPCCSTSTYQVFCDCISSKANFSPQNSTKEFEDENLVFSCSDKSYVESVVSFLHDVVPQVRRMPLFDHENLVL